MENKEIGHQDGEQLVINLQPVNCVSFTPAQVSVRTDQAQHHKYSLNVSEGSDGNSEIEAGRRNRGVTA